MAKAMVIYPEMSFRKAEWPGFPAYTIFLIKLELRTPNAHFLSCPVSPQFLLKTLTLAF